MTAAGAAWGGMAGRKGYASAQVLVPGARQRWRRPLRVVSPRGLWGAPRRQLARHWTRKLPLAELPDRRVVTGGDYRGGGRVLVWDPAEPGTGPVELGRVEDGVGAVAVLPDGRVVTGAGGDRVRLWDVQSSSPGTLLACSVYALATSLSPDWSSPLHRSRSGRTFMLGGPPSDTEHA